MRKHFSNIWKDFIKNPDIKDGEDWEDDVADFFFPADLYDLIHRSHDVNTNSRRYILSSLWPDFWFRDKKSGIEFRVECKLRNNYRESDLIDLFKPGQLQRYQQFENTFLLLCTYFDDQEHYYLVPVWHIKYDKLYRSVLAPYEILMDPPILPGLIKKYLK